MPEFNVRETFEEIAKAKSREEKREVLKKRENFATKVLLQLNYHPDAVPGNVVPIRLLLTPLI